MLWDVDVNEPVEVIPVPQAKINAIEVSPDDKFLALGDDQGVITIIDLTTKEVLS